MEPDGAWRNSRARWIGAVAIVVLIACGGRQVPPSATETEPEVTLRSPGSEPRSRVLYAASATTERVEIKLKLRTETEFTNTVLETGKLNADLPTILLIARFKASAASRPGHTAVVAELEDARVVDDVADPVLRQRLAEYIERLRTWKARWDLAPNGRITDLLVEPSKDVATPGQLPGLAETMGDTAVPFPDADIGVGATWTVKSRRSLSGATWQRTTEYRVRELHGSTVVLDIETVMHAPSQVLRVEPNATTRLTSGQSRTISTATIHLDRVIALGDSQASSEVNLSIVRGRLRIISSSRTETLSSVSTLP